MRVGILGYGDSSYSFSEAVNYADGCKLMMIGGRNVEKAKARAEQFKAEAYGTTEEMLARDDIDCVAISTPPGIHAETAVAFADKGVHLMVEKPMALTVADCRKIIDAARRNNVKLQVTQTQRYMDYAVSARRAVESGIIGAPLHIQMSMCWDYFTGKRSGWQVEPAMSGGGVTMNPFIHMIDFVRYVSLSEVKEYHGAVGYHKPGYTIEGDVECFARFENGATAFVYVDGYGEYKYWGGFITCEKGVLLIDVDGKRLEIRRHGSPSESLGVGRGWVQRPDGRKTHSGYLAHVEEMRDAIEKGGPLKSDGLNGMKNVEIAEGILRAARAPGYA